MKKFLNFLALLHCSLGATPVQISPPIPGYTDPFLANTSVAMNQFFQLPTYAGSTPYLGLLTWTFNSFLSPTISINPCNDRFVHVSMQLDQFNDRTNTYGRISGIYHISNLSTDGGFTWQNEFPADAQLPVGLGGTLAHRFATRETYDRCGNLLIAGKFVDLHALPPLTNPITGIFFSRSKNNGRTWSNPKILDVGPSDAFTQPNRIPGAFYINFGQPLPAPNNCDIINVLYGKNNAPNLVLGDVWAARSTNGGKTWFPPQEIYSLVNDPVWVSEHLNPSFNPPGGNTFPNTGIYYDDHLILLSITRAYSKIGSTTFVVTSNTTTNFDRAVIRSSDNGKTWDPVAYPTAQYIAAANHDPASPSKRASAELAGPLVRSPVTGRVYLAYPAGNTEISTNPAVAQFFPCMLLNVSYDKGRSWSNAVRINRTPTNIPIDAQQVISPSMAIGLDGTVVVCYYDFRNWSGGGVNQPLETDCWLDIYKEVKDPQGGSTGVGLDFVREVRLTPESFDARLLYDHGVGSGLSDNIFAPGTFLGVNRHNTVLAVFGTTHFSPPNTVVGFQGMTQVLNNVVTLFTEQVQLPQVSNQ